jgi:hypothetical protein
VWRSRDVRLEVWLTKDTLADAIVHLTDAWDVSLVVRGRSGATSLGSATRVAEDAWHNGVKTVIYGLYDRDESGMRAVRTIERELPQLTDMPVAFELLGVTDQQVLEWNLPTRPAKASDPEAKKFTGPAVELDAIPPDRLVALVKNAITRHIDPHAWEVEKAAEEEERKGLLALTSRPSIHVEEARS